VTLRDAIGEMRCNVCEQEPAVGVAASPLGAISLAYGARCLQGNVEASYVLAGNIYTIGPNPQDYAAWFWEFNTFVDGRVISAREYFDQVVNEPGFFDPPPEPA
jgi:hypothetical protein